MHTKKLTDTGNLPEIRERAPAGFRFKEFYPAFRKII